MEVVKGDDNYQCAKLIVNRTMRWSVMTKMVWEGELRLPKKKVL